MIYEQPFDVLTSLREPYSKNTLWLFPHNGEIDVKIFDKGWKIISSTEDKGLSKKSEQQINTLVEELSNNINYNLLKEYGKQRRAIVQLKDKQRVLENKISELENKLDKLTKRYATLKR